MINEEGVPVNTTAGVEGPKSPIKFQTVPRDIFRRAVKMKKKQLVKEALKLDVDILFCVDTEETLFLEN